jgi:hypothetical protein
MTELLLDAAGRRRSPATMPGFHAGRPPRNKGIRHPTDPPTVEEIVAVMRTAETIRTVVGIRRRAADAPDGSARAQTADNAPVAPEMSGR